MDKKVILFNGPPGSGKDTAAVMANNYLEGKFTRGRLVPHRPSLEKFAEPLKEAAHKLYGIPYSTEYYENQFGNAWKDKPQIEFFGKTPREIYISLSEDFAKLHGGQDFFGRIAKRNIHHSKSTNVFIYSDSGFAEEAIPVIGEVGIENVLLVEMHRTGTSFSGDSRGYVSTELNTKFAGKLKVQKMPNDGDKGLLRALIHGMLSDWLNIEE